MDYYEQPLWIHLLDDWRMGMTIEERIKNFQRGKLEMCIKCGKVFFDMETPGERHWINCFTPYSKHECIELENYIILMRSHRGVLLMVTYPDSMSEVDAICGYFKKLALDRNYEIVKNSRLRF